MNKINIGITLCILLTAVSGISQTRKQYLKAADNAFAQENYYAALKYYEEVLKFDSAQTEIWYAYGNSAVQFNAFTLADTAYNRVLSAEDSYKYPTVNFKLAMVKKSLGDYAAAIGYFQKTIADTLLNDMAVKSSAKDEMAYCEWAAEVVASPDSNIQIERFDEGINTPFSEFGAVSMGADLYYTSFSFIHEDDKNDPPRQYNKILLSKEGNPGEFWDNINSNSRHTAHTAFSQDTSKVYFTYCDYTSEAEIRCELYYREKDSVGMWGKAVKLPSPINLSNFTTTEPQVAKMNEMGEEWLFFVSDRPEGAGGMDIWYCVIAEDGTLGTPQNLSAVNTSGDDITPFFHTLTQTLYFSNNSMQGLGGFDIFKSVKDADSWSAPEHTGYPLNSSYDDLHYKPSPGGAMALLASNRLGSTYIEKEKEACCHDIYRVETQLVEFLALTFNKWTMEPLEGVTVTMQRITGKKRPPESATNPIGNDFHFAPERRHIYVITAERDGYHPYKDTLYLDRDPLLDMVSITKEIPMEPAEVDLLVLTFDDYTKDGLVGATVQLFEVVGDTRVLVEEFANEQGNDFKFKLKPGKSYIIRGSKSGYEHDLDTIPAIDPRLKENRSIQKELYLVPLIFAEFLPITLYFDNDEPDRNTWATETEQTYLGTWDKYYSRKQTFLDEFGKGMNPQMKFLANQRLEGFFDREVKSGGEALKIFSDLLYEFLQQGNKLEIVLRGYTSPRAASDYNENLSKRRIVSVRNHFENYREGIYKKFLDSGKLVILEKPYGESKAKSDVSDKLNDVRNSIYGIPASLERRVEIIDVKQADDLEIGTK